MPSDRERTRRTPMTVRRWLPSASMAGLSVVLLLAGWPEPLPVVEAEILLVLAWLVSPWPFPRSRDDVTAREDARTSGAPLIYWRPGCVYCLRLRLALGRRGNRAVWVDVSRDADASARVRSVNDGNETVPTVFTGGSSWTNPAPALVRDLLRA